MSELNKTLKLGPAGVFVFTLAAPANDDDDAGSFGWTATNYAAKLKYECQLSPTSIAQLSPTLARRNLLYTYLRAGFEESNGTELSFCLCEDVSKVRREGGNRLVRESDRDKLVLVLNHPMFIDGPVLLAGEEVPDSFSASSVVSDPASSWASYTTTINRHDAESFKAEVEERFGIMEAQVGEVTGKLKEATINLSKNSTLLRQTTNKLTETEAELRVASQKLGEAKDQLQAATAKHIDSEAKLQQATAKLNAMEQKFDQAVRNFDATKAALEGKLGKVDATVLVSNALQNINNQNHWLWPGARHVPASGPGVATAVGHTITIGAAGTYEIIADLNVTLNGLVVMVINNTPEQQRWSNHGHNHNIHFQHVAQFEANTKVEFRTDNVNSTPQFNGTNNTVTVRRLA